MVGQRFRTSSSPSSSLPRQLVWPGTLALAVTAMAACGGSSENGNDLNGSLAGSGGSLGFSGTTGTVGTTAGRATSSSGSNSGGKSAAGGEDAMGGMKPPGESEGGNDAGGAPDMPPGPMDHPMRPPGGVAGASGSGGVSGSGGTSGAGGAAAACPMAPPANEAVCTTAKLKCNYPNLVCSCDGMEQDRSWHCKEPKATETCPAMAPTAASPCMSKEDGPPAPPCHYEAAALDCTCTADAWTCIEAKAP